MAVKESSATLVEAMPKSSTRTNILLIALFVGIITVCSWIKIPIGPVPVTLQTFAVCLTVSILGTKRGTAAVGTYLVLGLLGVPVFAGFAGGVAYLFGVTGGYILGFVLTAFVTGKIQEKIGQSVPALVVSMVAGLALCYAFGVIWFMVATGTAATSDGLMYVLGLTVTPFMLPEVIKIALATSITKCVGYIRNSRANKVA